MGDKYPVVRVAAVQAAAVFLDREKTTEKACRLIIEAGRGGAQIIVFPEGFIPSHPNWYHHHPATSPIAHRLSIELFKNSVEIPGPDVSALCAAAREANAYVIMGVCEKLPNTLGTMFNTQIYIAPDGRLIGKHQKTMPTFGERLVHKGGFGDTFGAFQTSFGPVSGLICGENANPLAICALTAEGTRFHAMSWPPYIAPTAEPLRELATLDSRAFAEMSGAYVISACGAMDEETLELMQVGAEHSERLRHPTYTGGSLIVAPTSEIIAGPMGPEEGILYADCDLELGIRRKIRQDLAGHYNRAEIFQLRVNRSAPTLYAQWNAFGPNSHEQVSDGLPGADPHADVELIRKVSAERPSLISAAPRNTDAGED